MSFDKLDPQMCCFALVGQFLHAWSKMEGSLHNAIGLALGIAAEDRVGGLVFTKRQIYERTPIIKAANIRAE